MNVTSLLTRLSNFAPPSVPASAEGKAKSTTGDSETPTDRFGPASRVGLSEQAQKLLNQFRSTSGEQLEDSATLRIHRPVAYSPNHQPTPQQMAEVYKIAAQYAYDVRPDAAQRMMEELRQQGLHPDQLAREATGGVAAEPTENSAPAPTIDAEPPRNAANTAVNSAVNSAPGNAGTAITNGFILRPAAETSLVA